MNHTLNKKDRFIPALNCRWLNLLYDPLIKRTIRETVIKQQLIVQSALHPGYKILDLGCGTGTLTLMIERACPSAEIIGVDGDQGILKIAVRKAKKQKTAIAFQQGMAFEMPYRNGSFDRVVSCLVFHHLSTENKIRAFKEAFRVLKNDGELHVADFGKPQSRVMSMIAAIFKNFEPTGDNIRGLLPQFCKEAGFQSVKQHSSFNTIYGTIVLFSAKKNLY